jgi:hypothetical protein
LEVKINREIREYTESIFFGLSMRQFIFSVCACLVAVILYFFLKPYFGIETLSWLCILGATPCAILGFVKYNGMTAEQFILTLIKSEILMPKKLVCKPTNIYEKILQNIKNKENIKKKSHFTIKNIFRRRDRKKNENIKKSVQTR